MSSQHNSGSSQSRATSSARPRRNSVFRLLADVLFVARREKKLWMTPLVIVVLLIAAVLGIAALAGPVAPFIYPLL